MHNGRSLTRSEHRRHDRLLVTRFAMDDAYPSERNEARSLVESCADCAALAADVRVIARSTSHLPAPRRTRDFMITAERAEQLRGTRLTRWLRTLAMPGFAVLRPVAGVALSIGLVMAVVGASIPGMQSATLSDQKVDAGGPPAAAEQPGTTAAPEIVGPVSAPGTELAPDRASGQEYAQATPGTASDNLNRAYIASSPDPNTDSQRVELAQTTPANGTRDILVYAGLLVAVLSFALLALAVAARRYFADPLLR